MWNPNERFDGGEVRSMGDENYKSRKPYRRNLPKPYRQRQGLQQQEQRQQLPEEEDWGWQGAGERRSTSIEEGNHEEPNCSTLASCGGKIEEARRMTP